MKRKVGIFPFVVSVLITIVFLSPNPGFSGFGDDWPAKYKSCGIKLDSSLDKCLSALGAKEGKLFKAHKKARMNCQGKEKCLKKASKAYLGGYNKTKKVQQKCDKKAFKIFIGCLKKAGTGNLRKGHKLKDVQKSIAMVRKAIEETLTKCRHKKVFHKDWRIVDMEATKAAARECYDTVELMIPKVLEAQLGQHFK